MPCWVISPCLLTFLDLTDPPNPPNPPIPLRWQTVIPTLISEGVKLDGIFWDTYAEYYRDMKEFHDALPLLLSPGGVYSYFNGLAPDNLFFHMVYARLVSLEMNKLGFETSFEPIDVESALEPGVWEGVKNKYWHMKKYFLPTCHFNKQLG